MKFITTFSAAILAFQVAVPAQAQDAGAGQAEYMNSCASCHGVSGTGDGPLAELMTVEVSDLTQLSAANDGAFPMLDVIMTIDGRSGIHGHGYPMPVWGNRFEADAEGMGDYASEIEVRGRVLSLAMYLQSIQQ